MPTHKLNFFFLCLCACPSRYHVRSNSYWLTIATTACGLQHLAMQGTRPQKMEASILMHSRRHSSMCLLADLGGYGPEKAAALTNKARAPGDTYGGLQRATPLLHYHDVSLVDGFYLPVTIKPIRGGMGCGVAGGEVDLNVCCPSKFEERRQGKVVGCKSTCMPGSEDGQVLLLHWGLQFPKELLKSVCHHAYSFAYDDPTNLRTCRASRTISHYLLPSCKVEEWGLISVFASGQ